MGTIISLLVLKLGFNLPLVPKTRRLSLIYLTRSLFGGKQSLNFLNAINLILIAPNFLVVSTAQKLLPPQVMSVLFNTNTLYIVILGALFLGENPTIRVVFLVITAFFGVSLIVCPSLYGFEDQTPKRSDITNIPFYAYLLGGLGGLINAIVTIISKAYGISLITSYLNF